VSETHLSPCRFGHSACLIEVAVENGRPVRVIGENHNEVYFGYTCAKGRVLPEQHPTPGRLLHSQRRMPDGSHQPIGPEEAMDEIADKVEILLDRYGPRSIATYTDVFSFPYPAAPPVAIAFMEAIGSPMRFTPSTIEQSRKLVGATPNGSWQGRPRVFHESDTWLMVGANQWRYNPAFMHPDDLAALGLTTGDALEITSSHASILSIVELEDRLRRGGVSMAYALGDSPKSSQPDAFGSNTGQLSPADRDYDPYTGIPRMSMIPVNVERHYR
jgi:anaerobic selenocysteine-containing dehydrogenase